MNTQEELRQRDYQVNWHPYTQMKSAQDIIPIVKGKGAYLYDANNKSYIDAVSSWWVTLHGHSHPYIAQRVSEQLLELEQVIFAGFTHGPAIELSERLLELLPENQSKVFYSDNGSTAIEVALKMAVQYHYNTLKSKTKIVAFTDAYHGDTFGAMSVSGRGIWTKPFGEMLFEVVFIDPPTVENLQTTLAYLEGFSDQIACFIYEPLVQGAAGMLMHEPEQLSRLLDYFKSKGVLLIQDEVFVGFGRTGTLFAADVLRVSPDMMCFSKGLTGGTMPLGITTCTDQIYQEFYQTDTTKALFHGHSFTANPLACVAALASMDLLLHENTQDDIKRIVAQHKEFANQVKAHGKIQDIRQCGTILAIEWRVGSESSYFHQIQQELYRFFLDKGILIRPLGNIVYLVPPYCISEADLNYIYRCILEALDSL